MTDCPILFSAPMVQALFAGRKTQTRRIFKLPTKGIYERKDMGGWEPTINGGGGSFTIARDGSRVPAPEAVGIWHRTTGRCLNAPYQSGDRLWVREAWRADIHYDDKKPSELRPEVAVRFEADGTWRGAGVAGRYRSGRFMPRWASRIMLTVTDVRVQRLQKISEADAVAEGVPTALEGNIGDEIYCRHCDGNGVHGALGANYGVTEVDCAECATATQRYRNLWDGLNAERGFGWETNPWVVAVSFDVEKINIDAAPRAKP